MEMPTPDMAYDVLAKLNIAYERLDHAPITSVRDTDIVLPGQQVKNLCLKTKKGKQYFLVILRDEKSADLKRLAEALGVSPGCPRRPPAAAPPMLVASAVELVSRLRMVAPAG